MEHLFELAGRPSFVKVDLDAILHNYFSIKDFISKQAEVIAVVKGNAYGHGDTIVSSYLQSHGCSNFAVATGNEGQKLRRAGIRGTIVMLGGITQYDFPCIYESNLTPNITDTDMLRRWIEYSKKNDIDPGRKIMIEVDVGINRNGCTPETLADIMELCDTYGIQIHSIMTHFPNKWNKDDSTEKLEQFLDTVAVYRKRGVKLQAAASGPIANGVGIDLDYVRPGNLLYGIWPDVIEQEKDMYLRSVFRPAFSWFTTPNLVKEVAAGTSIGYVNNMTYKCETPHTIAVLPVGFSDGYSRRLSGKTCITDSNGLPCQILGSVYMNAVTVKVESNTTTADVFCLLNDDRDQINTSQGLAALLGRSHSDILVSIRLGVPRLYQRNGKLRKEGVPCNKENCVEGCIHI